MDAVEWRNGHVLAHRSAAGWLTPHERADVYPVEVRRDPPDLATLRERIEADVAARRRYSVFDTSIEGTPYQIVALLAYEGTSRERLDRIFGTAINVEWAWDHYSATSSSRSLRSAKRERLILRGNSSPGAPRARTLEPTARHTVATRVFPVLFFDPMLVAVDPPADLRQRSWTVAASAEGDPTFARAARGARRSLIVVGAGVALLAAEPFCHRPRRSSERRRRHGPRRFRRHGHARAEDAAFDDSSSWRNAFPRGRIKTEQDLTGYAHLLVREERRLTRLVNNLLAYSRVTDVTEVYSFEHLEPAALVSEATQAFRWQLTDSDVRLETDVQADVPAIRRERRSFSRSTT